MRLQHIRAMARKEWWHLWRDPRSLAMILLMPTMQLFLFGYAIRLDILEVPLGLLQETYSTQANDLAAGFAASHAFDIVARFEDRAQLDAALHRGEVAAALVIPADFALAVRQGDADVQLIIDGTDANTARLVRNYAQALINNYALPSNLSRPALSIETRTWFNEAKESRYAIVPGVIAIVMAVIGALMTSLTIAREVEHGNIVMLRTTALTRAEFLLGKLAPYFVIGMVDLAVAVVAAVYLFNVPLRGSVFALVAVSAIFLLVVMFQGALISIIAGSQLLASQMSLVSTFLPAFLLSGFIFAIENMPVVLQYLTLAVPSRYYVALSKLIFLKGVSPLLLIAQVFALLVMLAIFARLTFVHTKRLGLLA